MFSASGRALTGAWIETANGAGDRIKATGRALTGAWIETGESNFHDFEFAVAPSRARGLKQSQQRPIALRILSRPHGRVD